MHSSFTYSKTCNIYTCWKNTAYYLWLHHWNVIVINVYNINCIIFPKYFVLMWFTPFGIINVITEYGRHGNCSLSQKHMSVIYLFFAVLCNNFHNNNNKHYYYYWEKAGQVFNPLFKPHYPAGRGGEPWHLQWVHFELSSGAGSSIVLCFCWLRETSFLFQHVSAAIQCFSFVLLHDTFVVVSEMTYTVSSGTLNSTIPFVDDNLHQ